MLATNITASPLGLFIAFIGGMISILSPCVLPILPGLFSMVSGMTIEELKKDRDLTKRVVTLCLLFAAGFSAVYIVIGVATTQLSRTFLENQTIATRIGGIVLILLAIFLLVGHFTRYRFFVSEKRPFLKTGITDSGAFITGAAFGFGWSPCIGPILAGVLTYAATTNSLAASISVVLAYCLGLSTMLTLIVYSFFKFEKFTNFLKRNINVFVYVTIAIMLFFGFLLAVNQMAYVTNKLITVMDAIGLNSITTIG